MKIGQRFLAVAIMIAMLGMPVLTISASGLSDARKEKEALEQELERAKALIEELKESKEDIESKVRSLDAHLTEIAARIFDLENEMQKKDDQIENTREQLVLAEQDEEVQYEAMKVRIKYMYEHSSGMSLMEAFFSSGSIAEFLEQAEYIRQITNYDRKMLKKYEDTQSKIADTKSSLEIDYAQLEELKTQVQKEQQTVKLLLDAKEQELQAVNGDLSGTQAQAEAVAAEIQAQDEIIAQIQAEEARKEQERQAAIAAAERRAQQAENTEQPMEEGESGEIPLEIYSGGAFTWPCPTSTRVTSDYGERLSPTEGASSDHKGLDIGADYGAPIVAAADGTVSYAGYNNGMGNYVMISHGSGLYTVYGHCSALLVETGAKVSAGQTIAQVGSTGISTGNHLHFGVSKDGAYVSPWNYFG